MIVEAFSVVTVPSASAFALNNVTNVQLGSGSLTLQGHSQPNGPFRQR
jgi:hypothetical protein